VLETVLVAEGHGTLPFWMDFLLKVALASWNAIAMIGIKFAVDGGNLMSWNESYVLLMLILLPVVGVLSELLVKKAFHVKEEKLWSLSLTMSWFGREIFLVAAITPILITLNTVAVRSSCISTDANGNPIIDAKCSGGFSLLIAIMGVLFLFPYRSIFGTTRYYELHSKEHKDAILHYSFFQAIVVTLSLTMGWFCWYNYTRESLVVSGPLDQGLSIGYVSLMIGGIIVVYVLGLLGMRWIYGVHIKKSVSDTARSVTQIQIKPANVELD